MRSSWPTYTSTSAYCTTLPICWSRLAGRFSRRAALARERKKVTDELGGVHGGGHVIGGHAVHLLLALVLDVREPGARVEAERSGVAVARCPARTRRSARAPPEAGSRGPRAPGRRCRPESGSRGRRATRRRRSRPRRRRRPSASCAKSGIWFLARLWKAPVDLEVEPLPVPADLVEADAGVDLRAVERPGAGESRAHRLVGVELPGGLRDLLRGAPRPTSRRSRRARSGRQRPSHPKGWRPSNTRRKGREMAIAPHIGSGATGV